MSGVIRLSGDAFSEYCLDHVLLEERSMRERFFFDRERYGEARALLRTARRALSGRVEARSTISRLLRPLGELWGWRMGEPGVVETMHGSEDAGLPLLDAAGSAWARVRCTAPDESFDVAPAGGHRRFAAQPALVRVLEAEGVMWGIVLNAVELRVVRRADGQVASWLGFDLGAIADGGTEAERAWRILDGLLSERGVEATPRSLDELVRLGREHAVSVGKTLGRQVREALIAFASGLYADPDNRQRLPAADDSEGLARTYGQILRILYRCLFALYAESRALLPVDLAIYRESYAVRSHARALVGAGVDVRGSAARLKALFRLLRRGADLGAGERVPAYGGELFAEEHTADIEALRWSDEAVAEVLRKLAYVEGREGLQPVSYRELDVEQLGSIYEGLLEQTLAVAQQRMWRVSLDGRELVLDADQLSDVERRRGTISANGVTDALTDEAVPDPGSAADEDDGDGGEDAEPGASDENDEEDEAATVSRNGKRAKPAMILGPVEAGTPYLKSWLGRKESASYYTSRTLVDYLVRETIDPLAKDLGPQEILRLRVVDPAMGSGHFLVGAMRRLAEHLLAAYHRAYEERGEGALHPALLAVWHDDRRAMDTCRLLVAGHCLYGVDKNPLAVDLARVALWLATAAEGHPLSFLDHRLRCGDSLLHIPLAKALSRRSYTAEHGKRKRRFGKTLAEAQPQMEFVAHEGALVPEDPELERALVSRLSIAFGNLRTFLEILEDETQPFQEQQRAYVLARGTLDVLRELHAAVVGRLWQDDDSTGPMIAALDEFSRWRYAQLSEGVRRGVEAWMKRAAKLHAFSWELEFPEIYYERLVDGGVIRRADAGFDAVLSNPPWDKVKIAGKEFYARYDPLILESQGQTTKARIAAVDARDPRAAKAWAAEEHRVKRLPKALAAAGTFTWQKVLVDGKTTGGDADLFKYFTELSLHLLRSDGRAGLVTPGAFTSNEGTTGLRRLLFDHARIESLIVFENRRKLFDIDSRFKFQVLTYRKGGTTEGFGAAYWQHETTLLTLPAEQRRDLMFYVRSDDVRRFSAERLALLEFRSERDQQIAMKMMAAAPPLGANLDDTWNVEFGRELDMSQDSKLFQTRVMLERLGAERDGDVWRGPKGETYIPLYEGRMVQAFDANAKRYVSGEGRSAVWEENGWPKKPLEPHYWAPRGELSAGLLDLPPRVLWCDLTGATNERTLMSALVPRGVVSGNTLFMAQLPDSHAQTAFLAVFNSLVLDYLARFVVSTHANFFHLSPLPFPRRLQTVALEAAAALCHAKESARDRADLRALVDASVAVEYGLSDDELRHIVESFWRLDNGEPPSEGEVHSTITRDLVLAEYCRLTGAHGPEYADRVRAARAIGAIGYVATPLRKRMRTLATDADDGSLLHAPRKS